MFMSKEIDDIDDLDEDELEVALIQRKRHDELKGALGRMVNAIAQKDDKPILEAINKQTESLSKFATALQSLPKQEKPEVNVEVNQDKLITSVNKIGVDLLEISKELLIELKKYNERPVVDNFEVTERVQGGFTKRVKVNYKN